MLGNVLPVNEVFHTIQGEATHAGRPSVFVRLQGCPVGCAWCDTKHTWDTLAEDVVPMASMLNKTEQATRFYAVPPLRDLLDVVTAFDCTHVVITGGEPCMYDLAPFTQALLQLRYGVQVETSGTFPINVYRGTWVTLSPKFNKPGGREVIPDAFLQASEVKLPVAIQRDVDDYDAYAMTLPYDHTPQVRGIPVWLQPVWQNAAKSSVALCTKVAKERNWRVSLQTHKYVGIR